MPSNTDKHFQKDWLDQICWCGHKRAVHGYERDGEGGKCLDSSVCPCSRFVLNPQPEVKVVLSA